MKTNKKNVWPILTSMGLASSVLVGCVSSTVEYDAEDFDCEKDPLEDKYKCVAEDDHSHFLFLPYSAVNSNGKIKPSIFRSSEGKVKFGSKGIGRGGGGSIRGGTSRGGGTSTGG